MDTVFKDDVTVYSPLMHFPHGVGVDSGQYAVCTCVLFPGFWLTASRNSSYCPVQLSPLIPPPPPTHPRYCISTLYLDKESSGYNRVWDGGGGGREIKETEGEGERDYSETETESE